MTLTQSGMGMKQKDAMLSSGAGTADRGLCARASGLGRASRGSGVMPLEAAGGTPLSCLLFSYRLTPRVLPICSSLCCSD